MLLRVGGHLPAQCERSAARWPVEFHSGEHARAFLLLLARGFPQREMSLATAARAVGVSRWHLSRIIARETGLSWSTHLNGFRLLQAALLLRTTEMQIKEVAFHVGYRDTSELDRQFAAWYRIAPGEVRSLRGFKWI